MLRCALLWEKLRGQDADRFGRRPDERGAVAVVTAVLVSLVLVVTAAIAVDLGMQRVLRRDLQALVDVVALDLSRDLERQKVSDYSQQDRTRLDEQLRRSVARNDDVIGGPVDPAGVHWELVTWDEAAGEWRTAAPSDLVSAVRVTATSEVGFAFGGVTGVSSGGATRSAVAVSRKQACLRVSSYAADLDTGRSWLLDALLGQLLGSDLALRVLDPEEGLLDTDISLLELIPALDALVSTDVSALSFTAAAETSVALSKLVLATIHVLEKQSGRTLEVDLLRQVLGGIQANVPNIDITLSDLVELDTAGDAAAELDLDLIDILGASLAIANGTNVIDLPARVRVPLPLGAGGRSLVDLTARVTVGQQPIVQCEGTVRSSQIVVELSGRAADLDLGLVGVTVPLHIRVGLANTSATALDVRCVTDGTKRVQVAVDSGLLDVAVHLGRRPGDPAGEDMRVKLLDTGLSSWRGITVVSGTLALTSGPAPNRPTLHRDIDIVEENYDVRLPASSNGLGAPTLHLSLNDLRVLGGLGPLSDLLEFLRIGSLLNWVVGGLLDGLVNPLVATLDTWLLAPLLDTLGTKVAGGTVQVAPTADCGTPSLRG